MQTTALKCREGGSGIHFGFNMRTPVYIYNPHGEHNSTPFTIVTSQSLYMSQMQANTLNFLIIKTVSDVT